MFDKMMNKRCMILTTHFLPLIGGAQNVYDSIARQAAGNVSVLTASNDYTCGDPVEGHKEFDLNAPYKIFRLDRLRPNMKGKFSSSFLMRIKAFLSAELLKKKILRQLDRIVHSEPQDMYCIGSLDALGWMIPLIQKRYGKKVIIYIHGEEISQKAYSKRAETRRKRAIAKADHMVVVSDFTKECLINDYNVSHEKISVLTNGVDFDQYQQATLPPSSPKKNRIRLLSVGRLVERKGFDNLIRAFEKLGKEYSGVSLKIVGEGEFESYLTQLINDLSLQDRISLTGKLSSEELLEEYAAADIFAMPNRTLQDGDTEGFGLVFLEAAAAKTAIIGGNAGGVPSAIKHGETGMLVDGADIDDIADTIIKLLDDPDLRAQLTENAYHFAQSQDWSVKADEFQAILQKVCQ